MKNTFLDIKTPAPDLRRVYTEPGRAPPEEVEYTSEASVGGACSTAATGGCEALPEATDSPDSQPPEPPQMVACELGNHRAEGPQSSSEWPGFGFNQRVIVKNTFLDLDDDESPAVPTLRRVKTEPLPRVDLGDPAGSQGESSPRDSVEGGDEGEFYRMMSCESVESSSEWNWGLVRPSTPSAPRNLVPISENSDDDVGQAPVAAEPAPAVAPSPAAAAGVAPALAPAPVQMAQGVMMVPSGMLMPGVVGMGTIDNLPPGCVAVPVDRYARWPGGLPPVAPPCQAPPVLSRVKSPDTPPEGLPSAEPEAPAAAPAPAIVPASLPSPKPQAPDQPVLQRAFSVASAIFRVNWTVAARKLKSKDQFAVSPTFELSFKTSCEFKLVIHPTKTSDQKGGKSFLAAKGKGRVELKCETQLDSAAEAIMTYRISVGAGDKRLPPRGPVKHNFAETSVSGLAAEEEEWDFSAVLEDGAQTFVVCLEVLPSGAA